ncbi:hypothetical protein BKI52_16180 [marine bacterium AO1-C]|nr:hypothetical protein BKI52_16180 [marine bacterium AO1-C]
MINYIYAKFTKSLWLCLLSLMLAITTQAQDKPIVIKEVNLIDVIKGKVVKKATVIIEGTKIKEVYTRKPKIPADAKIIEGQGKWLMPGMVDGHIHFFQSGGLYTRPDAIDLRKHWSYEKEQAEIKKRLPDLMKRYLRCGVTTIIDVGGPMTNYDIKKQYSQEAMVPNILVTGPLISTYQPEAFKIKDAPIIKVNTPEEARALVQKQLPYKPDFIKIWYIARNPEMAEKNLPIIKATIDEAHKNNLKVTVHATQLNTAMLAVKAGTDILVHSVDDKVVSKEFVRLLKKNKVTYIPTLIVSANYLKTFTTSLDHHSQDIEFANPFFYNTLSDLKRLPNDLLSTRIQAIRKSGLTAPMKKYLQRKDSIMAMNLKTVHKAGVNVVVGTDAGNIGTMHASSYLQELEAMQRAGLTNLEVLKTATINAARGFNRDNNYGSVSKGKVADLLLLDANPLEKLANLNQLHSIFRNGKMFKSNEILQETPEQVVQRQVNAYNARDIEGFLATYSKDVEIYNYPNKLSMKGRERMRKVYGPMFKRAKHLHCKIVNRIRLGNKVVDRESVIFNPKQKPGRVIAVYTVKDGLISKVTFIRGN